MNPLSSPVLSKKSKPSDQGIDSDWDYLLSSQHHSLFTSSQDHIVGLECSSVSHDREGSQDVPFDTGAVLFVHIPAVLFALHLVYEVNK